MTRSVKFSIFTRISFKIRWLWKDMGWDYKLNPWTHEGIVSTLYAPFKVIFALFALTVLEAASAVNAAFFMEFAGRKIALARSEVGGF